MRLRKIVVQRVTVVKFGVNNRGKATIKVPFGLPPWILDFDRTKLALAFFVLVSFMFLVFGHV